jgi:hypothetical protein
MTFGKIINTNGNLEFKQTRLARSNNELGWYYRLAGRRFNI